MLDFRIAALAILVVAGAYLVHRSRKSGTDKRDEVDPEAPRNVERGRAASEAAAGAPAHQPLSDADAETVAELHEYFREIGTGEQAIVTPGPPVRRHHVYRGPSQRQLEAMRSRLLAPLRRFEADPLAAPIPDLLHVAEPVLFGDAVDDWFGTAVQFVAPANEPKALPPLDFTGEYNAASFARMVAGAKAEASR